MNVKKSRVLVTGGCGFIGSHIVDRLIELKHEVIVIDNLITGRLKNLNQKAIFFHGDVNDPYFLKNIFSNYKFDYVYHLASIINTNVLEENQVEDVDISVLSTINLCKLCVQEKIKKIIFASSVAVYGRGKGNKNIEDSRLNPIYSYGIAKITAENYLRYFEHYYGLKYQILRYSNIYGPRQPIFGEVGVIAIFTSLISQKKPVTIFGDGSNHRDYLFVEDAVDFSIMVLEFNISETYNVAKGKSVSVNEVYECFKKSFKRPLEVNYAPERFGEIGNFSCSSLKARKTGWRPNHSLLKGINKTLNYYIEKDERS